MAVKYVKDFSFPSSGGFHRDVQRFAKGGHVTKVPAKAKASAKDVPARAKPNAPARGAPKMKSEPAKGKRQGYNEGGRVPGYDMDRLPAKKPPGRTMDLARSKPFKGAYEGYADGGEVYDLAPVGPTVVEEYDALPAPDLMLRSEPLTYRWSDGTYNYLPEETGKRTPLGALSSSLRAKDPRSQEPVYARDVETRLDRGVRPGQMARQQRVEDRMNAARQALFEDKAPTYLRPPMEEPTDLRTLPFLPPEFPGGGIDEGREFIMPVESPRGGGLLSQVSGATLKNPMIMEKQDYDPGLANLKRQIAADSGMPPSLESIGGTRRDPMIMKKQDYDPSLANLKGSSSTREPMLAPYMPTYSPTTREESDSYLKAAGIVPRAESRFAKGGKVQKVMREYKEGKLHSGSKKGPLVKNREQAVAIALSEARKAGAKSPKKGDGGIFNDESMAYQSKGPKTRYTPAKGRRMARERAMERRALDKARHAEKYAPGLSLDMPDRKKHGGMMKGKKFPDLTGDGKVTRADVLKGRGVIKDRKMPTHNRKPMYGKG